MLLFKGWLETRFRLLFALSFVSLFLVQLYSMPPKTPNGIKAITLIGWICLTSISIMLAGAGIATQPSFQVTKGLHGSTLFTLSLPVSRLRLLAVRASLGWLEMSFAVSVMCCAMWFLLPQLRSVTSPEGMLQHTAVLIACGSALYSIPVFLGTFLDDQWRLFGSFFSIGVLWWLLNRTWMPASVNIFRAMSDASPIFTHTMPWTAMAFSMGLAAILFFAALKVARAREY